MASEMLVAKNYLPTINYQNKKLGQLVVQHMQNMQAIADVTRAAIDEISDTTGYAEFKVAATLNAADLVHRLHQRRGMSPTEEETYHRLEQHYLNAITHVTNQACAKIALGVQELALPDGNNTRGEWKRFVDELMGW